MTGTRRISTLGAQTLVARVAVYAMGFVTSILIARAVGPSGRGRYYLVVTIVTVAYYIANMGTEQAQLRLWAQHHGSPDDFVTAGYNLAGVLGVLSALTLTGLFLVARRSLFAGVHGIDMLIVIGVLPFRIHFLLLNNLLIMNRRLAQANGATVAGAVVQLVGTVALFASGRLQVEGVLILFVASIVVPWVALAVATRAVGTWHLAPPVALMRRLLAVGAQFEPYILFFYLNQRLDVFFVNRYRGLDGVGLYSVAVTFGELIWLGTDSVATSVLERQANADAPEAADVTLRAVRMNVLLAIAAGAGIAVVAPVVIPLLYGSAFRASVRAAWAILPATLAMGVWRTANTVLVRFASPWVQPAIGAVALASNIAGNIVLTPHLGIVGAALASVISYGCGAIVTLALFVRLGHAPARDLVPRRADVAQLVRTLRPSTLGFDLIRTRSDRPPPPG